MIRDQPKRKVGDLVQDRRWPSDPPGIIVEIDYTDKEPYKVYCSVGEEVRHFGFWYIEEECELISESR